MAELALGIDIGTAKACIATVGRDGAPRLLADELGRRHLPTVISFGGDGNVLVGEEAAERRIVDPANTVRCDLRLCQPASIETRAGSFTQVEINGIVIDYLRRLAGAALGQDVRRAVVAVPVCLPEADRRACEMAATLAGLRAIRQLEEPIAIALAYGLDNGPPRTAAIYDFGAGKVECALLSCGGETVPRLLGCGSDLFLGGDAVDERLVAAVSDAFRATHGVSFGCDQVAIEQLRATAEKAKRELSSTREVAITLEKAASTGHSVGEEVVVNLGRAVLLERAGDLFHRALDVCDLAMAQASVAASEISEVILAGGMTRIPLIQEQIAFRFGRTPRFDVVPEEAVAVGTAVYAARYGVGESSANRPSTLSYPPQTSHTGPEQPSSARVARVATRKMFTAIRPVQVDPSASTDRRHELLEVTASRLAIGTVAGYCEEIIPRDQPIPLARTRLFSTGKDGQQQVRIQVCQGDSRQFRDNKALGEVVLDNLPVRPRGEVKIAVTFSINADGILEASAKDELTGQAHAVHIKLAQSEA
ncbi:MAG: Hsp70 family protein [Pseudomonadota bacterium]